LGSWGRRRSCEVDEFDEVVLVFWRGKGDGEGVRRWEEGGGVSKGEEVWWRSLRGEVEGEIDELDDIMREYGSWGGRTGGSYCILR
jgi:hypothetical protein